MNLKTYISIKFILYIFFIIIVVFLSSSIENENKDLKSKNEVLLEQKSFYEKILKLKDEEVLAKKNLYVYIKVTDSRLNKKSENGISIPTSLSFWFVILFAGFSIHNFLENKIKKLKSEESDFEKQQML